MFKLFRKPVAVRLATPPQMPSVRAAQHYIEDAQAALVRATKAWNLTQLNDAIRSANNFLEAAVFAANHIEKREEDARRK